MSHLFNTYNNARLLYPNFYDDSYLGMMRILDALSGAIGAYDIATFVAKISPDLNRRAYEAVNKIGSLKARFKIAEDFFQERLNIAAKNPQKFACLSDMKSLDTYGKFIFSCLYSAYEYRSKFVHQGFPFPTSTALSPEDYLSVSWGISHIKTFRPGGSRDEDSIDIHEVLSEYRSGEIEKFKNTYFLLLPTWFFIKEIARAALMDKISKLP